MAEGKLILLSSGGTGGHMFPAAALAHDLLSRGYRVRVVTDRRGRKYEGAFGGASRIDFLLEGEGRPPCYLEIKNVHLMRRPGVAEFPDSVTARGARHLEELAAMAASGPRAVMLYVVQIGSAEAFGLARDIDPAYGRAFDRARAAGVEALAWRCRLTREEIGLMQPIPVAG